MLPHECLILRQYLFVSNWYLFEERKGAREEEEGRIHKRLKTRSFYVKTNNITHSYVYALTSL